MLRVALQEVLYGLPHVNGNVTLVVGVNGGIKGDGEKIFFLLADSMSLG